MDWVRVIGVAGSLAIAGIFAWRGESSLSLAIVTAVLGYIFGRGEGQAILRLRGR